MKKKQLKRLSSDGGDSKCIKSIVKKKKIKHEVILPKKKKSKTASGDDLMLRKTNEKDPAMKLLREKKILKKLKKKLNASKDSFSRNLKQKKQSLGKLKKKRCKEGMKKSLPHVSSEPKKSNQVAYLDSENKHLIALHNNIQELENKNAKKNRKIKKRSLNDESKLEESFEKFSLHQIDSFIKPLIHEKETKLKKDETDFNHNKEFEIRKAMSFKREGIFQDKRDKQKQERKLARQAEGQYGSFNKLPVQDLKKKMLEIQNREKLSKSAARKLRVLKKILIVAEDTIDKKETEKKKVNLLKIEQNINQNKSCENQMHKISNKLIITSDDSASKLNKAIKEKDKKKKSFKANKFEKYKHGSSNHEKKNMDTNIGECDKNNANMEQGINKIIGIVDKINSEVINDEEKDNGETNDNEELSNKKNEEYDDSNSDSDPKNNQDKDKFNDSLIKIQVEKVERKKNDPNSHNKQSKKKKRYVLFVGNLVYSATTVDIKKHFLTKVDKVKDVRIPLTLQTNSPRGFAYVEVENSTDYEKALSLHGTFIKGRSIKVEYTKSGSKSAGKLPEVIHKNRKLHALRKAGILAGSKKPKP